MDAGIISRGVSEWATPTVLVRKRDGTVRYCIDVRKVNEVTVKDRYPLPKISECNDALAGCEYFSCLGKGVDISVYLYIYMYFSEGRGLGSYQTTWLCNNNVGISGVV